MPKSINNQFYPWMPQYTIRTINVRYQIRTYFEMVELIEVKLNLLPCKCNCYVNVIAILANVIHVYDLIFWPELIDFDIRRSFQRTFKVRFIVQQQIITRQTYDTRQARYQILQHTRYNNTNVGYQIRTYFEMAELIN